MSRARKIDRLAARYAEEERLRREDYPRYLAMRDLADRAVFWKAGGAVIGAFLLGMLLFASLVAVATSERPHPAPCGPAGRP